jgi:outer membrane protein assembly factor BamB
MRRALLVIVLLVIAAAVGYVVIEQDSARNTARPGAATLAAGRRAHEPQVRPRLRARPRVESLPWPTYGFDLARTHSPGFLHRPPFRKLWSTFADSSFIEFPPVIAYDRLYVGTNYGLVLAIDSETGRYVWRRELGRCIAASPTVGRGVVYVATMDPAPCSGHDAASGGYVAALNARTGALLWRYQTGLVESSPLLVGRVLYFGSWDRRVYAIDTETRRLRWSFTTRGEVKAGAAFAGGSIFIGSYDGHVYALDARTGKLRWSAAARSRGSAPGKFYATPAVAHGVVYAGATDGTIYAFRAEDGRLAWSRDTGNYVYAPAAVWRHTVYVGSYDHRLYALDAGSGVIRWVFDAGHAISGAPTVLGGLVYFSTCGGCRSREADAGARRTFAVDGTSGKLVWTFPDGEYSPVVADPSRAYLTGLTNLYALVPRRGTN